MTEAAKRPTITELEAALNHAEEGEVEILPNGDVVRLSPEALVQKKLRLAREEVELLRGTATELRDGLRRIVAELEKLVGHAD